MARFRWCGLMLVYACGGGPGGADADGGGTRFDGGDEHADAVAGGADAAADADGGLGDADGGPIVEGPFTVQIAYTGWQSGGRGGFVTRLGAAHAPLPPSKIHAEDVFVRPHRIFFAADDRRLLFEADHPWDPGEDPTGDLYVVDMMPAVPGSAFNVSETTPGRPGQFETAQGRVVYELPSYPGSSSGKLYAASTNEFPPSSPVLISDPDTPAERFWLAPDGSLVLFATEPPVSTYWVSLAGGAPYQPAQLPGDDLNIYRVLFSGDSRWVFLVNEFGTLLVDVSQSAPDETYVLDEAPLFDDVVFSADDSRLVILGSTNGRARLYTVDTSSSSPGPLVEVSGDFVPFGDVSGFRISPDGDLLVFEADREVNDRFELYAVDLSGSEPGPPVKLSPALEPSDDSPTGGYYAVFSPDGQTLLLLGDFEQTGAWGIYRVDQMTPTLELTTLVPPPIAGPWTGPKFSPDGTKLLMTATYEASDRIDLYVMDLTAAEPELVLVSEPPVNGGSVKGFSGTNNLPIFTPDSQAVAYIQNATSLSKYDLWIAEVSGTEPGPPHRVNDAVEGDRQVDEVRMSLVPDGAELP